LTSPIVLFLLFHVVAVDEIIVVEVAEMIHLNVQHFLKRRFVNQEKRVRADRVTSIP
jgi:hypothetical protein